MYLFSKIFWLLFNPGSILLALSIICVYAAWRAPRVIGRSQKPRWFMRLSSLAMMLVMLGLNTLPMRDWLVRPLEDTIPAPATMPKQITGFIILGGGIDGYLSPLRHEVIVTGAAARMIAAIRLAKQYPQAKIIYSGGNAALNNAGVSEAILAGQLWRDLGMSDAHLLLESRSRNTYENAVFSHELVQPQPGETWLLVTSAIHMPRALGLFRHAGWEVVPYPVGYSTAPKTPISGTNSEWNGMLGGNFLDNIEAIYWGSREWFGLMREWMEGRSKTLLPRP